MGFFKDLNHTTQIIQEAYVPDVIDQYFASYLKYHQLYEKLWIHMFRKNIYMHSHSQFCVDLVTPESPWRHSGVTKACVTEHLLSHVF